MSLRRVSVPVVLAGTILLNSMGWAAPGDVNSVNNGATVVGGTYYNTPGNRTVFTNSGSGGVTLHAGSTVTAYETNNAANAVAGLTGNGGNVLFYAPGSVVRLDGNVNASALMSGGLPTGNGGRVSVVSDFLYTNGNIWANGINGGTIDFSVGSLMLGPNTNIQAKTLTNGYGGVVSMTADDVAHVAQGAIVDTSGKVVGSYNTNLISIQGSIVNVDGILKADGTDSQGGTVRLVADGGTDTARLQLALNDSSVADIKPQLDAYVTAINPGTNDGNVMLGGNAEVTTNGAPGSVPMQNIGVGSRVGDGGRIFIDASHNVDLKYNGTNGALLSARGAHSTGGVAAGKGGFIGVRAGNDINFAGRAHVQGGNGYGLDEDRFDNLTGGVGGNGGRIHFDFNHAFNNTYIPQYNKFTQLNGWKLDEHYAQINASGGHNGITPGDPNNPVAGRIDFYGPTNPTNGTGTELRNVLVYRGMAADGKNFDPNHFGVVLINTKTDLTAVNQLEALNSHFKAPQAKLTILDLASGGPISPPGPPTIPPLTPPDIPGGPTIPTDPNGGPTDPTGSNPDDPSLTPYGLFQNDRKGVQLLTQREYAEPTSTVLIAYHNPTLFSALPYKSVTQEILNLAIQEFNRQLAAGKGRNTAFNKLMEYLKNAGVEDESATILVDRIAADEYTADPLVIEALKQLAALPPNDI